ncbi:MAG: chorismate synthase [Chlorobi bacterium]|nr:chorismate synthase [Chlorobiota bacterium]
MRFLTAGESHGKKLTTIVEGFPSNLKLNAEFINQELKRRQSGYGRGGRMKIESDEVQILSGVRYGKTLGSPITLQINNNDWSNWTEIMSSEEKKYKSQPVTVPRPGHADVVGVTKYDYDDIRNSIERSSARETAARVAATSVAKRFLEEFGITVGSFVESIGGIYPEKNFLDKLLQNKLRKDFSAETLAAKADKSSVRVLEKEHEKKIIRKIQNAKSRGDTLGGTFVVAATGMPVGLGSFVHYDRKLNVGIASAISSINAVKGVEIGAGFKTSDAFGSEVHDVIVVKEGGITRKTNYAGGIEGGVSTGLPIIVRAAMKPIATLMTPIETIDLKTGRKIKARRERSDFTAVPACAVIAEGMLAWAIAELFFEKFGGDSMKEIKRNYAAWIKSGSKNVFNNFK